MKLVRKMKLTKCYYGLKSLTGCTRHCTSKNLFERLKDFLLPSSDPPSYQVLVLWHWCFPLRRQESFIKFSFLCSTTLNVVLDRLLKNLAPKYVQFMWANRANLQYLCRQNVLFLLLSHYVI